MSFPLLNLQLNECTHLERRAVDGRREVHARAAPPEGDDSLRAFQAGPRPRAPLPHQEHLQAPFIYTMNPEETGRKSTDRCKEHRRSSSPVGRHMVERRHSVDEDSIAVVHRDEGWFWRGVAEAIHVQRETPTLILRRERHTLPPIYSELLSPSHH